MKFSTQQIIRDNSPPLGEPNYFYSLKPFYMKSVFAIIILSFVGLVFINASCKKNQVPNDCGCNAPIRTTITESQNLIGKIAFNDQPIQGYDSYKNKFIIVYIEPNCSNCIHHMVVCNEDILSSEMLLLKNNSSASLNVKFAGDLKPICDKLIGTGDETNEFITLTKITKQ